MKYELKQAEIVLERESDNLNVFMVRILPDMKDILETDLLPRFPNFFAKTNIAYSTDDNVWVLTNEDFTMGFILGLSQPAAGESLTSFIQLVNNAENSASFPTTAINEMIIERVGGKSFSYTNKNTGQFGTIYQNRLVQLVSQDGDIWLQNPSTIITITAKGDINIIGTSKTEEYGADVNLKAAQSFEDLASKRVETSGSNVTSASGNIQSVTSASRMDHTAGDSEEFVAKVKKESYGLGKDTKIVSGGDQETILTGDFQITVALGQITMTATAGMNLTTLGSLSLTALSTTLVSPTTTFPSGLVAPTGAGPFCAIPVCPFSGIPHLGNVAIGA
jgi:hypothetical protein